MHIWDIYLRIFHWLLVIAVATAIASIKLGELDIHIRVAQVVCVLILFRIMWGVIGYPTARFMQFIKSPMDILNYLKGKGSYVGHNPLGALSVIALIAALAVQVGSGLFTEDGILFEAPLYAYISASTQEIVQELHMTLGNILLFLIGLHVSAILIYILRGTNLIKPMINGGQSHQSFAIKYIHLKAFFAGTLSVLFTYFLFS